MIEPKENHFYFIRELGEEEFTVGQYDGRAWWIIGYESDILPENVEILSEAVRADGKPLEAS